MSRVVCHNTHSLEKIQGISFSSTIHAHAFVCASDLRPALHRPLLCILRPLGRRLVVTREVPPQEAADGADVVFTMVGAPSDVEAVTMGERGVLSGLGSGSLLVDMTTSTPSLAEKISAHAADAGVLSLDAGYGPLVGPSDVHCDGCCRSRPGTLDAGLPSTNSLSRTGRPAGLPGD